MNEFETAMVNEASVFKPLKFYCIKKQLYCNGGCLLDYSAMVDRFDSLLLQFFQ